MGWPRTQAAQVSPGNQAGVVSHVDALRRLQALAGTFSRRLLPENSVATLQVFLIVGTARPWRLMENWGSAARHPRRMLCFASLERIWLSVEEHLNWGKADEAFVARHMATPGDFPGVTADWVHTKDFERVFSPQREAIRARICLTRPDEIVLLSRSHCELEFTF
jgi:hypothetical protein